MVEERGLWKSKFDFSVAFLALTLGFQHISRFPFLVFKNGGGLTFTSYNMHVSEKEHSRRLPDHVAGVHHLGGLPTCPPRGGTWPAHRTNWAGSHWQGSARPQGDRLLHPDHQLHVQHILPRNDHKLGSHILLPKFFQHTRLAVD